jgi:hypothetical protein
MALQREAFLGCLSDVIGEAWRLTQPPCVQESLARNSALQPVNHAVGAVGLRAERSIIVHGEKVTVFAGWSSPPSPSGLIRRVGQRSIKEGITRNHDEREMAGGRA